MRASRINKKKDYLFLKIFVVVSFLFGIFLFGFRETKFWNSKDKLSVVMPDGNTLVVVTYDPKGSSLTTIRIPPETQIAVSRGLGTWPVGALWQLSINEGRQGSLVAESVTKSFRFPVFAWQTAGKTNLGLGDKIMLTAFSFGVKNSDRIEIDLGKTPYLKKTRLKDGSLGFTISENIPQSLALIFSDGEIAGNFRIEIIDQTDTTRVAREVGSIIEVLGPKVAAVSKQTKTDEDCIISGTSQSFNTKLARVFGCRLEEGNGPRNFDATVTLGAKFAERF